MHHVSIPPLGLDGVVRTPEAASGLVIFVHGSGSSRYSPRNVMVAEVLAERGLASLLFDLLLQGEEADRSNVFDIPFLAHRLATAITWAGHDPSLLALPIGLFGASTGAAAALVAAADFGDHIKAVVSRGGRPDLAGPVLSRVHAPTLLLVGGADHGVIELNQQAFDRLAGPKVLKIIPGASHLFPEPGALEKVAEEASSWFQKNFVNRDHRLPGT